jgi:hypothetical protein
MSPTDTTTLEEAERQVTAAVERYREVTSSRDAAGRPESGQRVAVKAVERALELLSLVLKRAVASGISLDGLAELTGWELDLVQALVERPLEPMLVQRAMRPDAQSVRIVDSATSTILSTSPPLS